MITIFTGHFGSGKTEVALNFAVLNSATIVDLDIVNPYFRTNDAKNELAELGIEVIASQFANTNVDLPSLPDKIFSVFNSSEPVVFDVGGDEEGASALGRYNPYFIKNGYEMYFVININRPQTSTIEGIQEMIEMIEQTSRLKVTGLINNSNLLHLTTREDIEKGERLVKEASDKLSIPFIFTSAKRGFAKENELSLNLYLNLPFREIE